MYKYINELVISFCLLAIFLSCQRKDKNEDYINFHQQSIENAQKPIRPGEPGKTPFWNKYAIQFQYAPAFNFRKIKGASKYRFIAKSIYTGKKYSFTGKNPWIPLSPIWNKLSMGYVNLKVKGLNAQEKIMGTAGRRKFYKGAVFPNIEIDSAKNYQESAQRLLQALYNLDHIQNWAKNGTPDHEAYIRYSYPSKIVGAVIWSMLNYIKTFTGKNERALKIAKNAADYLIAQSEAKGKPMAFFPPTYEGTAKTAGEYAGQLMMVYPAEVGMHYLELYQVTQNEKYLQAAIRIANTYKKTQLSNGTWYLKVYVETGKPVNDTYLIPGRIMFFLDQLITTYDKAGYKEVNKKALEWTMKNPVKTFNWSGQFEDVTEVTPYKNLSHIEPTWMVRYLLNNLENNREKYITLSKELLRFCEDQFVIWKWDPPFKSNRTDNFATDTWIIPAALEQYHFYLPITTSASRIILAWKKMYQITKEKIYLAKAIALSNSMLKAQNQETGHVSTYWSEERIENPTANYWLNNSAFYAETLLKMDELIRDRN